MTKMIGPKDQFDQATGEHIRDVLRTRTFIVRRMIMPNANKVEELVIFAHMMTLDQGVLSFCNLTFEQDIAVFKVIRMFSNWEDAEEVQGVQKGGQTH